MPESFLIKLQAEASNSIKKETLAQVFYCEFLKIFKNTFFTEHLRVTASESTAQLDWQVQRQYTNILCLRRRMK